MACNDISQLSEALQGASLWGLGCINHYTTIERHKVEVENLRFENSETEADDLLKKHIYQSLQKIDTIYIIAITYCHSTAYNNSS